MRPYAADFGQGPSFRSAICRELHLIPSKAVADNKLDISVIKHSIPSEIEGIEYANYLLFKGLTATDLKGDRTCGNDILREAPWESRHLIQDFNNSHKGKGVRNEIKMKAKGKKVPERKDAFKRRPDRGVVLTTGNYNETFTRGTSKTSRSDAAKDSGKTVRHSASYNEMSLPREE